MGDALWAIRGDDGLVTAEFAVALPAVIGVLLLSLAVVSSQVQAAQLQQLSAVAAHSLARSETEQDVKRWIHQRAPQATLTTSTVGGVLCATIRQNLKFVLAFDSIDFSETSCAWVGRAVGYG